MAVTYITEGSIASPPLISGAQESMVLLSRNPSRSGSSGSTVDTWQGPTISAREMYDAYVAFTGVSSINLNQSGAKSTVTITWDSSFNDPDEPAPDPDDPTSLADGWSVSLIEVPTPLAAHPYFQTSYYPASGQLIEDEIARCESSIKRGREYISSGAYEDVIKRYYGLRMAGVEEWTQYGVDVQHTYTTDQPAIAADTFDDVALVVPVANIGMPRDVLDCVDRLQKINDYTSDDPDDFVLLAAAFEYLKRPTELGYTKTADGTLFELTENWWGLSQWSKVIYPGGSWDPQGEVAV